MGKLLTERPDYKCHIHARTHLGRDSSRGTLFARFPFMLVLAIATRGAGCGALVDGDIPLGTVLALGSCSPGKLATSALSAHALTNNVGKCPCDTVLTLREVIISTPSLSLVAWTILANYTSCAGGRALRGNVTCSTIRALLSART